MIILSCSFLLAVFSLGQILGWRLSQQNSGQPARRVSSMWIPGTSSILLLMCAAAAHVSTSYLTATGSLPPDSQVSLAHNPVWVLTALILHSLTVYLLHLEWNRRIAHVIIGTIGELLAAILLTWSLIPD